MEITAVDFRDELSNLVDELGVHPEGEEVEESKDEDVCLNEDEKNLQEVYDALLEDCSKYAKVAKNAVRKVKKIEEENKSTLVQLKEAKCEVEKLKEELLNAYSEIKFLELEIIQVNVKVERISTKKLDSVLSSQKSSNDKTGLGYTGEGSSSSGPKKEVKFVSTKNVEKPKVEKPKIENLLLQREPLVQNQKKKGSHYQKVKGDLKWSISVIIVACKGTQGQIASSFKHSRGLILCVAKTIQEGCQREFKLKKKMRDNSLEMLWKCWRTFHHALLASPWGLRVMSVIPLHLGISPKTLIQCEWRRVLMHDHSLRPCINTSNVLRL